MSSIMTPTPTFSSMLSIPAIPGKPNEDFVSAGPHFLVLLDGATGLSRTAPIAPPESGGDAAWLSSTLGSYVALELFVEEGPYGISKEQTRAAVNRAAHSTERAWCMMVLASGSHPKDLKPLELPSATIDVVTWDAEELSVLALGDSPVVVTRKDGSLDVAGQDPVLAALSKENAAAMSAEMEKTGCSPAEARAACAGTFEASRLRKNTEGGYWVADVGTDWISHLDARSYPSGDVSSVLACSDGFSTVLDHKLVSDFEDLARRAANGEGESLARKLRLAEDADQEMREVLRAKVHDDCSFAVVAF